MKYTKLLLLIFLSCSGNAQNEYDIIIDSLNMIRGKAKTDKEKLLVTSQIRSILKQKGNSLKKDRRYNTSAIDSMNNAYIKELWDDFKNDKNQSRRLNTLSLIKKIGGLDTLFENINYYYFDYDAGTFDEISNYPVLLFLSTEPSLYYLEYIEDIICSESDLEKLSFLLLSTLELKGSYLCYHDMVADLKNIECVDSIKNNVINSHLNQIK